MSNKVAAAIRLGCAATAFVWLACGTAIASEESELLYSRGLVQFHAGAYDAALKLFDEALQASPDDVYPLYYRGVTHGRMSDYQSAVTDLRAAVDKKPDLDQAQLELGVALTQTGDYSAAVGPLEKAQEVAILDAEASFFLGLSQLRLGKLDAAQANFVRAAEKDSALGVPSQYYQGVIAYQDGEWASAKEHFAAVVQGSPASEMGREAETFIDKIGEGGRPQAVTVAKPYSLFGRTGFEYDSNVNLGPNDDQGFDVSDKADGRFVILAGGRYAPLQTERMELSIGYEFFQSLHFTETDFNLQDHRPLAEFSFNQAPFHFGIGTRYDYYLSGSLDSFLSQVTAVPWFSVDEGGFGRTEIFYRLRHQDYKQQSFDVIDGLNHSPGFRQVFFLGNEQRQLSLGYRYDKQQNSKSKGDPYNYDGQEVSVGLTGDLPAELQGQLFYAYRFENYASQSDGRDDHVNQVIAAIERDFLDFLNVRLAYFGNFHNSNQDLFQYDRNIVSLTVGVRY